MLNKKYKLLGKEELDWVCEFCGKKEISFCFTVQDMETGDIKRFGSVCIKKALGISTKELKEEIKSEIINIKHKYNSIIRPLEIEADKLMKTYRETNNYITGFLPQSEIEYWNIEYKIRDLKSEMRTKIKQYE